MTLFRIFTLKTIFYLFLVFGALSYYSFTGVDAENETDFIITLIAVAALCIVTITDIKSKMKSLNE